MKRTLSLVLLVAALMATACTGSEATEPAEGDAGIAEVVAAIDGRSWQLVGFADGEILDPVPAGVAASISFSGGKVSGSGGCNTFGGSFTTEGSTITFADLGMSLQRCESDAMDTERLFIDVLAAVETAQITADDRLILIAASGRTLVFVPI